MAQQFTSFSTLPLRNAFMFDQVMQNKEICTLFLEELLGYPIDDIKYIERQKDIRNGVYAKGIRLDIYVHGGSKVFNVEMQAGTEPDLPKRMRYYQVGMDHHELPKGEDYVKLPDTVIIFLCDYDPFGAGYAIYEVESRIKPTELLYDDGTRRIILNSYYRDRSGVSDAIAELLDYVRTNDESKEPSSELMKHTREQVNAVRLNKELEERYMTLELKLMDQYRRGRAEGRIEALIVQVCKKISKGKTAEIIADELEEELATIEKICEVVKPFAPDYNIEAILEVWK